MTRGRKRKDSPQSMDHVRQVKQIIPTDTGVIKLLTCGHGAFTESFHPHQLAVNLQSMIGRQVLCEVCLLIDQVRALAAPLEVSVTVRQGESEFALSVEEDRVSFPQTISGAQDALLYLDALKREVSKQLSLESGKQEEEGER